MGLRPKALIAKKRLVLLAREAGCFRGVLAEDEKAPQSITEFGQSLVVGGGQRPRGCASRVPILRRADGAVVGLVARRDLLLVRRDRAQSETEREAMIRLRGKKQTMGA